MKYFFIVVSCYIFMHSLSFAEEQKESSPSPAVYKAMETITLPYIAQCIADPPIVQEYLLVMEIEYLTWLKKEEMASEGQGEFMKTVLKLLTEKIAELEKLQKSCLPTNPIPTEQSSDTRQ